MVAITAVRHLNMRALEVDVEVACKGVCVYI